MRTAICILGQMRTFDTPHVKENFERFVLNKLNPDIFIATWDQRGHSHWAEYAGMDISYSNHSISPDQLLNHYNATRVSVENYQQWLDVTSTERKEAALSPRLRFGGEDGCSVPYLYLLQKVSRMRRNHEIINNFSYDCVIYLRPDLIFYRALPKYVFKDLDAFWHFRPFGVNFTTVYMKTDIMISNGEHTEYAACAWDHLEKYWPTAGMGGKYNLYKAMHYHMYGHRIRAISDWRYFATYREMKDSACQVDDKAFRLELLKTKRAIRKGLNPTGPATQYLLEQGFAIKEGIVWRG